MLSEKLPQFPIGAVYFRKTNPPKEDIGRGIIKLQVKTE